jgi:catechol 2,3-dioxygenase-like lactoylglutathione lyase family enzyme
MITAVHTLIYSDDAEATRAFFRDVLEWPFIDAHGGWLIFKTGPSELGVHPTHSEWEGQSFDTPPKHQFTLMCDDVEKTMADLKAKGVVFAQDVVNEGYGLVTEFEAPGSIPIMLYQPLHEEAYKL